MPTKKNGMLFEMHPSPAKSKDGKTLYYARPVKGQKLNIKQIDTLCEQHRRLIGCRLETVFEEFLKEVGYWLAKGYRIDTPIGSFKEITYKVINPGESNTLFDEDVVTSAEVAGQELLKGEICGGFVLNPTESKVNKIEIDVAFQRGLYYANDNGSLGSKTVQWRVDARLIDDEDNALSDWKTLGTETVTDATVNGIYKTYTYSVAQGRYEVRATRLDDRTILHVPDTKSVGFPPKVMWFQIKVTAMSLYWP